MKVECDSMTRGGEGLRRRTGEWKGEEERREREGKKCRKEKKGESCRGQKKGEVTLGER